MNPWFKHLAEVRKANPNIKDVGELAKLAKKTYKPAAKTRCIKTCVKKCKAKHNKTKKGGSHPYHDASDWMINMATNSTNSGASDWNDNGTNNGPLFRAYNGTNNGPLDLTNNRTHVPIESLFANESNIGAIDWSEMEIQKKGGRKSKKFRKSRK